MSNQPPQLSSLNDFAATNNYETSQQAAEAYSEALTQHRLALAAFYGISEDDLHAMRFEVNTSS